MNLAQVGWLLVAGGALLVLADMASAERRSALRGFLGARIATLISPAAVIRSAGRVLARDAHEARRSANEENGRGDAESSEASVSFRDYLLLLNPYSGGGLSMFLLAALFAGTLFGLSVIIAWLFEQNFFIANRTSVFYASLFFSVLTLAIGLLMRSASAGRKLGRALRAAFIVSLLLNPLVLAVIVALAMVCAAVFAVGPWLVAAALSVLWLVFATVDGSRKGSLGELGPRTVALGLIGLGLLAQLLGS